MDRQKAAGAVRPIPYLRRFVALPKPVRNPFLTAIKTLRSIQAASPLLRPLRRGLIIASLSALTLLGLTAPVAAQVASDTTS